MATVEVTFTPLPAHVRTARLVATAVARRSGVDESLLDEVRLAVGEACSRAVEAHQKHCPRQPIRVRLTDNGERFEVVVTDAAPADEATAGTAAAGHGQAARAAVEGGNGTASGAAAPGDTRREGAAPDGAVHQLPAAVGLAVIAGLADDVRIEPYGDGTSVAMSWKHRTLLLPRGARHGGLPAPHPPRPRVPGEWIGHAVICAGESLNRAAPRPRRRHDLAANREPAAAGWRQRPSPGRRVSHNRIIRTEQYSIDIITIRYRKC